jgi:hypothetical protein
MIVCGLNIDDNSELGQSLTFCPDCRSARAETIRDEMSGEWINAGTEVCSSHGQELAQAGVLLKKIHKTDTSIQDVLDNWEYRSN